MSGTPANPVSHLARRQQGDATRGAIAAFIIENTNTYGMSPTVREIADRLDLSTATVQDHLAQMVEQGRVVREGPRTRRGYSYRAKW